MAITNTTRLNIKRWSTDADQYTREHLDFSHRDMEERCAIFLSGPASSRPQAGPSNNKGFYLSTDENSPNGILYYSNGSVWHQLSSPQTATAVTPGDSANAGTVSIPARSDHVHSFNSFATSTVAVSGTSPQSASTISRGDHVHIFGDASVVEKTIAAGAVNASNLFTAGVVNENAVLNQNVTRAKITAAERIPTGTIFAYAGVTAPSGWMMCEGGTVTTGSTLGAMLVAAGSPYNTGGEGAGNVRVPDLRQRVPFGTVSGGSHTVTVYGGANTRTLSTANMATHSHNASVTVGTSSPELHSHGAGSLAAGSTDVSHTHTLQSHTHTLGATQIPDASFGYQNAFFGLAWRFMNGNGTHRITVTTGNATPGQFKKYDAFDSTQNSNQKQPWSFAASAQSTTSMQSATGSTTRHDLFNSTSDSNPSTHTHTLTGTLASTPAATSFDIVPEYTSVGYIIKL